MQPVVKWDDRFYVEAYILARAGHYDKAIGEALGVSQPTICRWIQEKPALKDAIERGRSPEDGGGSLREYVYGRLPYDLQVLWDRIDLADELDSGVSRVEQMLAGAGTKARQHLFLYALVHTSFDASEACRKVNVSKRVVDGWVRNDPNFAELLDEIRWHKGNFFEGQLVRLVKDGDPAAVLHVNKTFNRARGYGEVKRIEKDGEVKHTHDHQHQHTHRVVKVSELNLPAEVLEVMAEAMEKKLGVINANPSGLQVQERPGTGDERSDS